MSKQLVCQYLENVSRDVLGKYQSIIREYVGRRHGVYALYQKNKLYYVGLASNLRVRLNHHLKDRHADTWDRFSVYLTVHDEHIRELESLVIRIAAPKGNRQKGKFYRADDLKKGFRGQVSEFQKMELEGLFSSEKSQEKFKRRIVQEGREPALKPYVKKGFRIRFDYKGKKHIAKVRSNGKINYKGKLFNSPSLVGSAVTKRPTNGWTTWKYQRSPGEWVFIDKLRQ
jgi:predicted GIY-YIG superfamily endonuclease